MALRAAALLVLAVMSTSCGFKSEPIGSLPQFPQSASDALDRKVIVQEAPRRIVSLDPGMTEAAFDIGVGRLLVGGTGTETFPAQATKLRPMLNGQGKPNLRAIGKANPDLVLVPKTLAQTQADADRIARRLGIEVYVSDRESVKGIEHDILQLGLLTGHGSQARGLFTNMQNRIKTITTPFAGQDPVPVFVDRGYFYTIPGDGLAANLIGLAGGMNVAENADVSTPLTPAELRQAAPQVYLAVAGSGVTLQGLRRSPATRSLPAVRHKRFTVLPDAVFMRSGPRVVDSLQAIAQAIHPEGKSAATTPSCWTPSARCSSWTTPSSGCAGRCASGSRWTWSRRQPSARSGPRWRSTRQTATPQATSTAWPSCGAAAVSCWPASWASAGPASSWCRCWPTPSPTGSTTTSRRPCGRSPTAGS